MKCTSLFVASISLIVALSVSLLLFGVATALNAQLNLASPLPLAGAIVLSGSFVLFARSRRTTKQVLASRVWHVKNP